MERREERKRSKEGAMVDSGVLYNSDACFMISSVESPSRIFEKK